MIHRDRASGQIVSGPSVPGEGEVHYVDGGAPAAMAGAFRRGPLTDGRQQVAPLTNPHPEPPRPQGA